MAACELCGERRKILALGWCVSCYSAMAYWNKKPLKAKAHRLRRLKVFEVRMRAQLGNVAPHVTHRRVAG